MLGPKWMLRGWRFHRRLHRATPTRGPRSNGTESRFQRPSGRQGGLSATDGLPLLPQNRPSNERLKNDPAMGVIRHADAGYDLAIRAARERGVDMPSLEQ